jgi:hypothetical protein
MFSALPYIDTTSSVRFNRSAHAFSTFLSHPTQKNRQRLILFQDGITIVVFRFRQQFMILVEEVRLLGQQPVVLVYHYILNIGLFLTETLVFEKVA